MRFFRPRPVISRELVSVVIPCYRYGRYLEDAVGSVLRQEGVDVEVIIVDDASDDDSVDIARGLAASDSRVTAVLQSSNLGHIATYNHGLARATGTYVVLLSADDALAEGALARAVSLMQHHPTVGMVYGHAESFSEEVPSVNEAARSWTIWRGKDWFARMCGHARNPVYTPSVMMRREAWNDVGAYDSQVPHAADMLLWYQTSTRWDIGRVNSRAQAFYRVHGRNMHLTQFAGMLRDLSEQRDVVEIVFGQHDELPGNVRSSALRSLARRARRLSAAARRDGDPDAAAEAYERFASTTIQLCASAAPSAIAHTWDRLIEHRHAALLRRAEVHLRWRLWRRFGT